MPNANALPVYLGIDVGKTNLRLRVFSESLTELARWHRRVTDVPSLLDEFRTELLTLATRYPIAGTGISTFGPLDVDPASRTYGAIPVSSDAAWSGINLPRLAAEATNRPVHFDYDVNAGALAEHALGAAQGLNSFAYLSVGTGIGAAFFQRGLTPGFAPQFGHTFIPRETGDDHEGSCDIHHDCLQGLASGRSLERRWKMPPEQLPPDHRAWDLQARYLARACTNIVYTFAPERILLASSGALGHNLLPAINAKLMEQINGFLDPTTLRRYQAHTPVILAALTPDSSLLGAALLARNNLGLAYN